MRLTTIPVRQTRHAILFNPQHSAVKCCLATFPTRMLLLALFPLQIANDGRLFGMFACDEWNNDDKETRNRPFVAKPDLNARIGLVHRVREVCCQYASISVPLRTPAPWPGNRLTSLKKRLASYSFDPSVQLFQSGNGPSDASRIIDKRINRTDAREYAQLVQLPVNFIIDLTQQLQEASSIRITVQSIVAEYMDNHRQLGPRGQ